MTDDSQDMENVPHFPGFQCGTSLFRVDRYSWGKLVTDLCFAFAFVKHKSCFLICFTEQVDSDVFFGLQTCAYASIACLLHLVHRGSVDLGCEVEVTLG